MKKNVFSEFDWFMVIWLAVLLFITAFMFQSCASLDFEDEVVRDKVSRLDFALINSISDLMSE